ncbi:GumC family protein [Echinimonas agarilytica]|uniref:Wzz/FepE/Etk N-terminal domain-containing protein n=1 Tax=Echinimonas agarilytica TaxID=1215918 RepID=A0AA42B771_9GAMM|nr:Wzz/FepE/Etk N-terminal domain-containing protein [Echinimonas agarilytica]MCM2679540.1 Wzz/FepE/Etk N-terminal domain-containing protein [Echinimonas agarilytica]
MGELLPRLYMILDAAWRRRWLIVVPILVLPILGIVVAKVSPRLYQSHTSMLVQETAKLNPFLEDLAVSSNLEGRMSALTTLLHSRHILTQVADDVGLINDDSEPAQRDAVISELSNALTVSKVGKDLIRIDYKSNSPQGMSEILQCISDYFIEELLAPERSSIRESERFLQTHLLRSREQLELAEIALANFRSENADGLPELHSANTERLSRIRQKLLERQAELAGAKQGLGTLDQQMTRTDPVVARLEEQIINQRAELVNLMSRYTNGHSQVQAVERNLRRLEQERNSALEHATSGHQQTKKQPSLPTTLSLANAGTTMMIVQYEALQTAHQRVNALQEEVTQLQAMAEDLSAQIGSVGEQERQLLALQRDLRVKRTLYEDLLTRYEMAQVTGALGVFEQSERIKIIDRPFTPSGASNLPWWMFMITGLFGGVLAGSGLALFAELSDSSLRSSSDVEKLLGVSVLSRIPPL